MGLPVKAVEVTVGPVVDEVTAVGSLLAEEAVMIRPEIDGRIVGLHFEEGQAVKRGQQLVTIDASEYTAQMAAIKAELRTERQRYTRAQELHEQKFITKEALDVQAGAVDRLAARVKEAQVRVDKTVIRAPFSGIVGLREVSPGAYVKAGADIVMLEKSEFDQGRFPHSRRSTCPRLARTNGSRCAWMRSPARSFEGRVYAIQPAVEEQTRTALMRARVKNNSFKLKPGMFVRVALKNVDPTGRDHDSRRGALASGQGQFCFQGGRRQGNADQGRAR